LKTAKFASDVSECVHEYDGFDVYDDGCFTSPEMQAHALKNGQIDGGDDNQNDLNSFSSNSAAYMDMLFKTQDTDQDGCLSQAERKAFCIPSLTPFNDAIFEAGAFQLMDKNGDGKLSKEEYMEIDWQKVQEKLFPVKEKKKWPRSGEQQTIEYK
jgi:Ca2+-binding EF-hand superfamily protein